MLDILYLDDYLAIVNKSTGWLVHRTPLDKGESRFVLQTLRDQIGQHVWPVHRLDKGTSGVLVFARDAEAARRLGAAFEAGTVTKRYLALVRGWPPAEGAIDHPLARDPERPSAGQQRRDAVTRFRRLATFEWPFAVGGRFPTTRYALVEAFPQTGRRHQIRRHFKHIGHPLVGDSTHGKGAHNRAVAAWLGTTRLWLHAAALELPHPGSAEMLPLQAPTPREWTVLEAG